MHETEGQRYKERDRETYRMRERDGEKPCVRIYINEMKINEDGVSKGF